jgi:hypothetical protein
VAKKPLLALKNQQFTRHQKHKQIFLFLFLQISFIFYCKNFLCKTIFALKKLDYLRFRTNKIPKTTNAATTTKAAAISSVSGVGEVLAFSKVVSVGDAVGDGLGVGLGVEVGDWVGVSVGAAVG